jgi:hypothetical protein
MNQDLSPDFSSYCKSFFESTLKNIEYESLNERLFMDGENLFNLFQVR